MVPRSNPLYGLSRRDFLRAAGISLVAACTGEGSSTSTVGGSSTTAAVAPEVSFVEPASQLSGDLRILMWSHFVPAHDEWFDPFVRDWGEQVGVNVTIDHIGVADVPAAIASEIQAGEGHDLLQYISPLSQFEPSVIDLTDVMTEAERRYGPILDICRRSSFNPHTSKFYGYAPAWAPDPGDYRKSLWEQVGFPDGPATWDDLLEGGSRIKSELGTQLGIGLSQEIDSNMAGRALLWSFGASIQDENQNVVLNSDAAVAAVEFMQKLYSGAMTDEVFAWNAASNNQGLIAGELSYILNSISAWRTAQEANPEVADDIFFTPALSGPSTALVAQHVMYNWIIPQHAGNVDAAKEFLLHYTENLESVAWHSKLYDFPSFPDRVPNLSAWLDADPFGAKPANKLTVLKNAIDWSTNVGHPGPASPAIGEVFGTFVIPNMFAKAARGELSPGDAVAEADAQARQIFAKWRQEGLIGGDS